MNQDNAVAEALERLAALATPGPYDVGPCNLVRALRDDLAVPLFEPRDTFMDPIPAPTVRDGAGDLVFRAGSNGARTSRALKQEVVNSQLVAALLNNLPTIIAALKAQRVDEGGVS